MAATISNRVFERLDGSSYSCKRHQPSTTHVQPSADHVAGNVCKFWLTGTCARNPCRFLHPDKVAPKKSVMPSNSLKDKQSPNSRVISKTRQRTSPDDVGNKRPLKGIDHVTPKPSPKQSDIVSTQKPSVKRSDIVSTQKVSVKQRDIFSTPKPSVKQTDNVSTPKPSVKQSDIVSNDFSKMAQLEGHQKAVTGIHLPSGTDKLFTSSEDGTVHMWSCHTGECMSVADTGAPVWCLENEGPWVFAGITNAVKGWNIETQVEVTLNAPGGHVYSLSFIDGTLFAGLEDGSIFRWKLNSDGISFEGPSLLLNSHNCAVVSLNWSAKRLYSGSLDKTIKVWDGETLCCIETLHKHSEVVMSLICWERYLFSCSLDKTIQVWGATETGELEVVYTHHEEHGIILLSGMYDTAGKPILLCSLSDNSVRIYDLPSFNKRCVIFVKDNVRAIHAAGVGGQFFTGDGTGLVSVWKHSSVPSVSLDQVTAAA